MSLAGQLTPEQAALVQSAVQRWPNLARLTPSEILDAISAHDLGVWSEHKRGYVNAGYQWEWYDLAQTVNRLALLAPREHAKSEIFSVNNAAWHSIYRPGHWTYIFCNSGDQGAKILQRIVGAIGEAAPELVERPRTQHTREFELSNWSRITVAGSGAAVRGAHPDLIVGDDVQDENNTGSQLQRDRLKSWWFGTVGGMAHPGTTRVIHGGMRRVSFPPTRIILVGTPFHQLDFLMGARENPMYHWRLYGAAIPIEEAA